MLIEARDVTKAFGAFKAVDNASVAPTLDPALDAELDSETERPSDADAFDPPPRPHLPPMTTDDAYEVSRHEDAMTVAEEMAGNEEVRPTRSRLRRWIAGES